MWAGCKIFHSTLNLDSRSEDGVSIAHRSGKFNFTRHSLPFRIASFSQSNGKPSSPLLPSTGSFFQDSMIYHWNSNSSWPRCYISDWVSPVADLIAGNKSYAVEGDVTAIEICTTPENRKTLKTMSWYTRPAHISLLGTVNFSSLERQRKHWQLDGC
jgi:hypothetical protein